MKYIKIKDQLNAKCLEKFQDVLGYKFITGLNNKRKVNFIQIYLRANKFIISFVNKK